MNEYRFGVYSFQDSGRAGAAQGAINDMVAEGWQINACYPNFVEVAIMWERPMPAAKKAAKSDG